MMTSPSGKRPYRQRVYLTVLPVDGTPGGEAVIITGAFLSKTAADTAAETQPGTITRRIVVKR